MSTPDPLGNLLAAATADASADEMVNRLIAEPDEIALRTVTALSNSGDAKAATMLLALAESRASAALRKEARRGLHRLRSLGLNVPRPVPASQAAPLNQTLQRRAQLVQARASSIDGVGSRALHLVVARPAGGLLWILLILNDLTGMIACSVQETTRRRIATEREQREQIYTGATWVELPVTYGSQLLNEALALQVESSLPLPREFQLYREAVPNIDQPFERALIYQELPPTELSLESNLLPRTPELLSEPELQGWYFALDEVRGFARERAQARKSPIVLSDQHRIEREQRIVTGAIQTVVTPRFLRGLRRRLEETAYIFWKTDRLPRTQLALAAAQALEGGALTLHPLLSAMIEKSLDLADEADRSEIPSGALSRGAWKPIE